MSHPPHYVTVNVNVNVDLYST